MRIWSLISCFRLLQEGEFEHKIDKISRQTCITFRQVFQLESRNYRFCNVNMTASCGMEKTIALIAALMAAGPALSAPRCEMALLFAVDVSASISREEYATQIHGLIDGLGDGIVADSLVGGQSALALVQWSGHDSQYLSLNWTTIRSYADLEAFRGQLADVPRQWSDQPTALGAAMTFWEHTFASAPLCMRQVVDVSGDGRSNEGVLPKRQRAMLDAANIQVNALAIENEDQGLTDYYRDNVITGPDAFVYTAETYAEFGVVMREKLYRELAIQMVSR